MQLRGSLRVDTNISETGVLTIKWMFRFWFSHITAHLSMETALHYVSVQLIMMYEFQQPCNVEMGNEISKCMYAWVRGRLYQTQFQFPLPFSFTVIVYSFRKV